MTGQVMVNDGHIEGYITVKEYAKKYGVTTAAVYLAIGRGRLEPTVIAGRKFFREDEPYLTPKNPGRKRRNY